MGINVYPYSETILEYLADEHELYHFYNNSDWLQIRGDYLLPPDVKIQLLGLQCGSGICGLNDSFDVDYRTYINLNSSEHAAGFNILLKDIKNIKIVTGYALLRFITKFQNKTHVKHGASFVTGGDIGYRGLSGWVDKYEYSSAAGAEVEVHKIDLGQIYTARRIGALITAWMSAANTSNYVKLEYSTDDTTYTEWWNSGALSNTSSKQKFPPALENVDVRYIRCIVHSGTETETIYVRVYWIPVWVA